MGEQLLSLLEACPYLEGTGLYETEGAGPLLRLKGGKLITRLDGKVICRMLIEIETAEHAFEICAFLSGLSCVKSVSAPEERASENGVRFVTEAELEVAYGQG